MNEWITDNQALLTAVGVLAALLTFLASAHSAASAARAAGAAGEQAEVSRKLLISDQRPWIAVRLRLGSDLKYFDLESQPKALGTGVDFKIIAEITNLGKTPALRVHTNIIAFVKNREQDLIESAKQFARDSANSGSASGRLVMPGENYDRPWSLAVGASEIASFGFDESYYINLFVCVSYEIPHDSEIHQTMLSLHLGRPDEFGMILPIFKEQFMPQHLLALGHSKGGFAS
jgi:hypothetical protein